MRRRGFSLSCPPASNILMHETRTFDQEKFGPNPKSGTHPWPPMAGHGRPWLAMAGHRWPWLVIPGLVMAGHGWPSRPAMAMASHDRPWPNMAGHGWSYPCNGQSMVSQGPSAQAHGSVWHCVPVFGFEPNFLVKSCGVKHQDTERMFVASLADDWPLTRNDQPRPAMVGHGRSWLAMAMAGRDGHGHDRQNI